jgi:uncharacterized NAD(P)/FAD-binding protein YdhS
MIPMRIRSAHPYLFTVVIVVFAGCSFETVYNRLDKLIPSYVEGLVTLDDVLQQEVELRSQALVSWHRNTQLIQYADWLRELQRDVNPQLDVNRLQQHVENLKEFWQSVSARIQEEMAELLPQLDTEQRRELFDSIADENEDFEEDYVDIDEAERIENYREDVLDNYENWLGELTSAQTDLIETSAAELRSSAHQRLERRRRWQDGIREILDSGKIRSKKTLELRRFFADFYTHEDVKMEAIERTNGDVMDRLTVQLVRSMTPDQVDHFVEKTDDYIRIFTELARE